MLSAFRCRSVALTCLISLLNLVGNGVAQESQHTYGEHGNAFQYEPEAAGAYYAIPSGWRPLEHLLSYSKGREHLVRGLIPRFIPNKVLKFRGAEAPVKITDVQPTFPLKGAPLVGGGSVRDVLIVRLDRRQNYRMLPITSGATLLNYRERLPKDHTPEISVKVLTDTSFLVTPKHPLEPGEYMLTFGTGEVGGFDFNISGARSLLSPRTSLQDGERPPVVATHNSVQ